jgi:hypothetical protein
MIGIISIEYMDQIIRDKIEIPYNLLNELLRSNDIEGVSKSLLLISHIIYLNKDQAIA